jgi:hypothetical protein
MLNSLARHQFGGGSASTYRHKYRFPACGRQAKQVALYAMLKMALIRNDLMYFGDRFY